MEPGHDELLTRLQQLADELSGQGFTVRLLDDASRPYVQVTNPDISELTERVLVRRGEDGSWCFWWPWQVPIGSADDLAAVAGKIVTALRSVEGAS
jgi:hypothetical protein